MDVGMCHVAQATRGNTDVLVRVVGEKGAVDEVKHVVEMVYLYLCLWSFMLPMYYADFNS